MPGQVTYQSSDFLLQHYASLLKSVTPLSVVIINFNQSLWFVLHNAFIDSDQCDM